MERLVTSHPLGSCGNWDWAGTEIKADGGRDVLDGADDAVDVFDEAGFGEDRGARDGGEAMRGWVSEAMRRPSPQ
jgi:hypothetical protein